LSATGTAALCSVVEGVVENIALDYRTVDFPSFRHVLSVRAPPEDRTKDRRADPAADGGQHRVHAVGDARHVGRHIRIHRRRHGGDRQPRPKAKSTNTAENAHTWSVSGISLVASSGAPTCLVPPTSDVTRRPTFGP
jgi:hypothetical protein